MDKGYENERFETLKIKATAAKKFRRFCKTMSKSQSMTLQLMIDFFEENGISPNESIGPHMQTLESKIKKRINALIAIIKDIEKHQIKPTNAMMQLLFKDTPEKDENQLLVEHKSNEIQSEKVFDHNVELEHYRNQYHKSKIQLTELTNEFVSLLEMTTFVKSNFGSDHYRLKISKEVFEKLRDKLSNVHHYNSTETNG